jgi:hypothetical protein
MRHQIASFFSEQITVYREEFFSEQFTENSFFSAESRVQSFLVDSLQRTVFFNAEFRVGSEQFTENSFFNAKSC